jgi:hypothetical protein
MPAVAHRSDPIEPAGLRGDALLARLRGEGAPRPVVDPGLAGGLRDWLEDGLAEAVGELRPDLGPVRVTKEAVNQVLTCEAHFAARRAEPRQVSVELARGTLVDALFRQWVTTGRLGDPWADGLAALAAEGDRDGIGVFVTTLPAERREALAAELSAHAARISTSWPVPAPSWMARTQERLLVPLAGGRMVLSGVIDLALGAPSAGRASVCVVEVKSGRRRVEHRADLHLYALMETLRSGAPPFRVATYYTDTGELDVEPVGRDVLVSALHRVLSGALALCRLASGAAPERTPNPLCAWCSVLPSCGPGRARAGTAVPRTPGDNVGDDALEAWDEPRFPGALDEARLVDGPEADGEATSPSR